MKRSKKIVILCHCLLNSNSKVSGLATFPGCSENLVCSIIKTGAGIIQLPCPELSFLGPKRWGMTKEQYDTPMYREHCKEILSSIVQQVVAYNDDGYEIQKIVGVNGSPTCGITKTCFGYTGGELDKEFTQYKDLKMNDGKGVMIEVLVNLLKEHGLSFSLDAVDEETMA